MVIPVLLVILEFPAGLVDLDKQIQGMVIVGWVFQTRMQEILVFLVGLVNLVYQVFLEILEFPVSQGMLEL